MEIFKKSQNAVEFKFQVATINNVLIPGFSFLLAY